MNRREFFPALGFGLLSFLFHINPATARQRNLADFLVAFSPIYDENIDWGFGSGRLLSGISGQLGNLLIYIDGVWISHSVDSTIFDASRQRLQIRRDNQIVFDYDPRLRIAPESLR
ncbi:MAG: hypothetical protein UR94_C0027G0006 [Parcubacteria group bacterium GW2011_GWA2_36_10]|nr:MAG: hypothetical protein UR94_C0027G0006 [Parcubacteria group bacterium GW2011_GWA2_36_10]